MEIAKSMCLFVLAGLCEIGGGYLVWICLRYGKDILFGILGGIILIIYGVIPTFQPTHFGRVYAAYGGIFIILAMLWGWVIDREPPDFFDLVGGGVCLLGVLIIMYWPRS
jgi:small multidrug resistance family-3 protein